MGDTGKSTSTSTTTTAVFVVPKEGFVVPVGSPDLRAPRALVPCSCRAPRPELPLGGVVGHPRPVAQPPSPPTPISSKEEGTLLDTVLLWLYDEFGGLVFKGWEPLVLPDPKWVDLGTRGSQGTLT